MISMKGCGEAFWVFTPFDPETTEKQRMINSAFEGQAQLDIWKKKNIQMLEGFAGENATELLCKQSLCQSQPNSKTCMKQKVTLLAAALSKSALLVGPHHRARGPDPKKDNPTEPQ